MKRPAAFSLGFLAILLPTLFLKHLILTNIYRGELTVVLKWAVVHPTAGQQILYTTAFFARDVAEVFALWGGFYLLGCAVLKLSPAIVSGAGILMSLGVMGANFLTFRELGNFVTLDTLLISLEWIGKNPEIVKEYLGLRNLLVVPVAAAWVAAPILVSGRMERSGAGRIPRFLSPAALALVAAACAALSLLVRFEAFGGRLPLWGYWSSTAASFLEIQERGGRDVPLLGLDELRDQYRALAYPAGRGSGAESLAAIDAASKRPRHIVVIAFETASRKYYPILDTPGLPAFARMQKAAITSERHFTTRTSTTWSSFSILSGTYAPTRRDVLRYGAFEGDGLGAILARRGYETTFIDSYDIDFHERDMKRGMWTNLGFRTLLDPGKFPPVPPGNIYLKHLIRDEHSFGAIRDAVLGAERRGAKALVFLSTMLGHYEWKSKAEDAGLPGREKLLKICAEYDRMIGELLGAIEAAGLGNDIILVVTGDHGLRNEAEFDSLGEPMLLGEAAFNVPFLLYAPGLLTAETRLPYATSHVDIAPTLLDLTGTSADGSFFHGESMLGPGLDDRAIFLMNTGLIPTDGYYWKGRFFTYNSLSEMSEVGRSPSSKTPLSAPPQGPELDAIPEPLRDPKAILERARQTFACTARYFAERRKGAAGRDTLPAGSPR